MEQEPQTWIKLAAYIGSGLSVGLGAIGAAIGEGHTASQANLAISRNPKLSGDIFKSMLVGQAIAESASIFALVIAMILIFSNVTSASYISAIAIFAAGLSMGLGAIGSGIGSGFSSGAACEGIERQPLAAEKLTTTMLIGSAVCQTPSIFAMVISFILIFSDFSLQPLWPTWGGILGAGVAVGFSAIGSGIGGGLVAEACCNGIARQPSSASPVTNVMLLGQAVTQTPAILGLLIAFILVFKEFPATDTIASAVALLSAGLCIGIGSVGPGIGEGIASSGGVKWIARNKKNIGELTRTMLVGMAVAESTAVYSMVVALVLIFVV